MRDYFLTFKVYSVSLLNSHLSFIVMIEPYPQYDYCSSLSTEVFDIIIYN